VSRAVVLGSLIRISSSVMETLTPRPVNASMLDIMATFDGVEPTMKGLSKPTPSIFVPDACNVFTMFNAAVVFALADSILYSL
jgi:hypothetical protein